MSAQETTSVVDGRRQTRDRGLLMAIALGIGLVAPLSAHEGHDHGGPAPTTAASGTTPRRLADGTVFLPKPTQRLIGIRTIEATAADHPIALELTGRVVADPNASARITAPRDGHIEPAETGLPHVGQTIAAGAVIGWLVPTLSAFEESQLRQRLADIERELALLLPRSEHLGVVNPNMPMGETTVQLLQEMQIQAQALSRQADLIKKTLASRIAIEAPIAGTFSEVMLARGASVTRGQALADIVDRTKARVEAFGFGAVPADIAGASARTLDGRALPLSYLGRAPALRQQAVPLLFAVSTSAPVSESSGGSDFGQPVRVYVTTKRTARGFALPACAAQRGPAGGAIVWEHVQAETFRSRHVSVAPLDADRLLVTGEITEGLRIVTGGAQFIGQVR